jgi:hypothetical protein
MRFLPSLNTPLQTTFTLKTDNSDFTGLGLYAKEIYPLVDTGSKLKRQEALPGTT